MLLTQDAAGTGRVGRRAPSDGAVGISNLTEVIDMPCRRIAEPLSCLRFVVNGSSEEGSKCGKVGIGKGIVKACETVTLGTFPFDRHCRGQTQYVEIHFGQVVVEVLHF